MEQMMNGTEPTSGTQIAPSASHTDSAPYTFSPREIARLRIYRAALTAGFYTDQCGRAARLS